MHTAAEAAHHLVGHLCHLLSVYINFSAIDGTVDVVVKGRLCIDRNSSAIDVEVTIAVDGIGVAGSHVDGDLAAVDLDGRRIIIYFLSSIDSIVCCIQINGAAVDGDDGRFQSFMRIELKDTIFDRQ